MGQIPHSQHVRKSITAVEKAVKGAIKAINQEAGLMLARGRYGKAEELIATAKAVAEFQSNVRTLRDGWQSLGGSGGVNGKPKADVTPQWEYYKPLLQCLIRLGGEAIRKSIEVDFEKHCLHMLKPGDEAEMARGMPRWKRMIQRCRKAMIQEGFLENVKGGKWHISEQGRKIAQ
ncbi:hypothetical protein JXO59_12450 [candidate division KSB1 bacterium]|nr:hypothetical protein [candidate division KSB1 bacterium]